MRKANAIDFWRGAALLNIFVGHIPGNVFERVSYRNFSLSDSSEAFFFLAGCALGLGSFAKGSRGPLEVARCAARRIAFLYRAQLFMTAAAIGILCIGSLVLNDPTVLQFGRAGAVFGDSTRSLVGLLLLSHQLQYFDILPLYIVLTAFVPLIVWFNARSSWLLVATSVATWVAATSLQLNLATWPMPGQWFFNPLSWQLLFVLGFVFTAGGAPGNAAKAIARGTFWPALGIVLGADLLVALKATPDPIIVDSTASSILFNKSFLGPARVIHFLAVLVVYARLYPLIERYAAMPARLLALLGRTSLQVFVAASLLSLVARILKYAYGKDYVVDLIVIVTGFSLLTLTAWWTECRRIGNRKEATPSTAITVEPSPLLSVS
jgi:hypothetical protein